MVFFPWIISKRIKKADKEVNESVKYFSTLEYPKKLLGNLEFTKKGIVQDKVIPIKKVIMKNFGEDKRIIDKFAKCVINCWKVGFSDRIFNFTVNNGIGKNGEVILMDFGEVCFSKGEIKKDILKKRWKRSACYMFKIFGKTKRYYDEKMEKLLTPENVEKYWPAKV